MESQCIPMEHKRWRELVNDRFSQNLNDMKQRKNSQCRQSPYFSNSGQHQQNKNYTCHFKTSYEAECRKYRVEPGRRIVLQPDGRVEVKLDKIFTRDKICKDNKRQEQNT